MKQRVISKALICRSLILLALTLCGTVKAVPVDQSHLSSSLDDQLSLFLDPTSSLPFERMLELLRLATDHDGNNSKRPPSEIFNSEGVEYPGPKLADLLDLVSYGVVKCKEAHFRRLVAWRNRVDRRTPLAGYLRIAIKEQRHFCHDYLNAQTTAQVASFEPLTREHFKFFLREDRVGKDFYVSPDFAISKLRSLIDKLESAEGRFESAQLISQSSQNFLDSCREITRKLGPLVPIRKDHDIFARLPLRGDNYFRAYDFCHHLVDFDFSRELDNLLYLDVPSRDTIARLGRLIEQRPHSAAVNREAIQQQNKPNDDEEDWRRISRAAVKLAQDLVWPHQDRGLARKTRDEPEIEEALEHIRRSCLTSLNFVENLLWLRKHNPEQLDPGNLSQRAQLYLKSLFACNQLVRMENVDILDQGLEELIRDEAEGRRHSEGKQPNIFDKFFGYLFTRMPREVRR